MPRDIGRYCGRFNKKGLLYFPKQPVERFAIVVREERPDFRREPDKTLLYGVVTTASDAKEPAGGVVVSSIVGVFRGLLANKLE